MILNILQTGEPVLRQQARALTITEIHSVSVQQLIESMRETMLNAPGVGLAAPQIGQPLQLAVIEDREEYHQGLSTAQLKERNRTPVPFHVIINPKITIETTDTAEFYEGCLSVAGFVGLVPRALKVKVECLNENAEPVILQANGWYGRILQHEIDHLHGTLCIDRMKMHSFTTYENYNRYNRHT